MDKTSRRVKQISVYVNSALTEPQHNDVGNPYHYIGVVLYSLAGSGVFVLG
jgi:hypothetical protein